MAARVLLIEDDEHFADAFKLMLEGYSIEVVWAADGRSGIKEYNSRPFAFAGVIADFGLPDLKGTEVCEHIRARNPDQEFLFTTGHQESDILIQVLETGSNGFIFKGRPVEEMRDRVLKLVDGYLKRNRILGRDEVSPSQAEQTLRGSGFIGRSRSLLESRDQAEKYKNSDYPTLIIGASGVGKELVARALVPKGKKLVAINCAGFADRENMLESELFGYMKGSFTGAEKDTPGLVTQADGNVLFFDELHQLSIVGQSKLLRFFSEMKYRRVGDHSGREIPARFKLIAAVQPDILARVEDGRFLPDLVRRVGQLKIRVAPLSERPEDIEPLVRHIQDEHNAGKASSEKKQFRISTVALMSETSWPNNVRDLQAAVRSMLTDCKSDIVEPTDFRNYLEHDCLRPADGSIAMLPATSLREARNEFESKILIDSLKQSRTRSEAAKRIGMPLPTFTRKLKELSISAEMHLKH